MKKLITLICALACILSLTACQNSNNDTTELSVDEATIQQYTETVLNQFMSQTEESAEKIINSKNSAVSEDNEMALAIKRGLSNWMEAKDDLGALVSTDGCEVTADSDSVTCVLHLTFEQRKADFAVTYNDTVTKYESIKIDPEYSLGHKMKNAGLNTLMGMGIVFIVLIFIAFIISLFKYISKFENYMANRKNKKEAAATAENVNPANAPVVYDSADLAPGEDPLELIAVITAAIAASENTSVDRLVVRSIKKRKNNR